MFDKGGEVDNEFIKRDVTINIKCINVRVNQCVVLSRKGNDNGMRINLNEVPLTSNGSSFILRKVMRCYSMLIYVVGKMMMN